MIIELGSVNSVPGNDEIMKEETILFECACSSREHQFIVSMDEGFVYGSIFLARLPLRKRLWAALKYVLGYHCCYGHFEEIIFRKEDAEKLERVTDRLRETTQENHK